MGYDFLNMAYLKRDSANLLENITHICKYVA